MNKKKIGVILLTLFALLVITGYILPATLISNGTEKFEGTNKQYAVSALDELRTSIDWIGMSTKLKVLTVEPSEKCKYNATIQSYGFFGKKWDIWLVSECGMHTISSVTGDQENSAVTENSEELQGLVQFINCTTMGYPCTEKNLKVDDKLVMLNDPSSLIQTEDNATVVALIGHYVQGEAGFKFFVVDKKLPPNKSQ